MVEASIPDSRVFDLALPGGALRVFVAWPDTPPPAKGWPVVLLLDAERHFSVAVQSARAQARRPALTHVEPALVVGVAHLAALETATGGPPGFAGTGGAGPLDRASLRLRDFTPPAPTVRMRLRPNGQPWPEVGGAAAFRRVLRDLVLPRLAESWPIDQSRMALFGHSLAGLFALDCLLEEPGLFSTWLVSSPSLWFGDRILFDRLDRLEARLRATGARHRMLLSVGALEETVPTDRQAAVGPAYLDWVSGNRMVGNARDLAERLAPLEPAGLSLRFRIWDDETHITAPAVAIGQGLRLALKPDFARADKAGSGQAQLGQVISGQPSPEPGSPPTAGPDKATQVPVSAATTDPAPTGPGSTQGPEPQEGAAALQAGEPATAPDQTALARYSP